MAELHHPDSIIPIITETLFESLEGGSYDLDKMRGELRPDTEFTQVGIDSLELVAFFLRVEDNLKVGFSQDEYSSLNSLAAVAEAIGRKMRPGSGLADDAVGEKI